MISIRTAYSTDAPALANLIMQAMSSECCAYFYGPHHSATDFHHFLTQLAACSDSQYSYQNALVAVDAEQLVGAAVSYDGASLYKLRKPFLEGMLSVFERDFRQIKDETQAGELYLDSLAVCPDFRHRGIATKLLNETVFKAHRLSIPNVGLLVDDNNPQALHLYTSLGFKLVGTSDWGGHGMKHLQKKTF